MELCIACNVEPQMGVIGRHYYKRCAICSAKYDAKRDENRSARVKSFQTQMREAK